jgi:hypothetical protein
MSEFVYDLEPLHWAEWTKTLLPNHGDLQMRALWSIAVSLRRIADELSDGHPIPVSAETLAEIRDLLKARLEP